MKANKWYRTRYHSFFACSPAPASSPPWPSKRQLLTMSKSKGPQTSKNTVCQPRVMLPNSQNITRRLESIEAPNSAFPSLGRRWKLPPHKRSNTHILKQMARAQRLSKHHLRQGKKILLSIKKPDWLPASIRTVPRHTTAQLINLAAAIDLNPAFPLYTSLSPAPNSPLNLAQKEC